MRDNTETARIVESMAYHWAAADDMVISEFRGERQQPMTYATESQELNLYPSTRSDLSILPLELLHVIILELDLVSIGTIRLLNHNFKHLIDTSVEYQNLTLHASPVLEYLSYMKLASIANLGVLHEKLTSNECRYCGDFGNFLFIPTLSRCCFNCIDHSPQLVVIDSTIAARFFSVSEEIIAEVPKIPTISSGWDFDPTKRYRLKTVVSYQQTRDHVIYLWKHHPTKVPGCLARGSNFDDYRLAMPVGLPSQDESLRFLVCITFPYLNTRTQVIESGLCCRGCEQRAYKINFSFQHPMDLEEESAEELEIALKKQNEAFTVDGFLRHFEECRDAKELWKEYGEAGEDIFNSIKYRIPMFPWRE
ncbi:hypothetical protein BGZ60DRAFT_405130 [Tricladium varicosporioides]|nr:hypothetical protein BGZ60DRAFT_405130 [Hymenoscyphus varicosporioides]